MSARCLGNTAALKNQVFYWFFNKVVLKWFLPHASPVVQKLRVKPSAMIADAANAVATLHSVTAKISNPRKSKRIL
tara:strand:- start:1272 stop:1499 length:228 start_codon:yes stop_codon:yes gene_type:complete